MHPCYKLRVEEGKIETWLTKPLPWNMNNLSQGVYPLQIYKYLQISPNWSAWLNLVYTIYVLSAVFDCLFVLCSVSWKSSQILIWQIHSLAIFVIQEDGRIQFDTITLGVTPISDHYCSTEQSQRQSYIISNQLRRVTTELPPGSWTSSGHLTVQGLFKNCKGCLFSDWKWPFAGLPFLD